MLLVTGLFLSTFINAQITTTTVPLVSASQGDSTTEIEILFAESMRTITLTDGTELQTLAGNASVRQGNTTLRGDSIVLNSLTGIAEVFGHVHISDADTVNTYSSYLKYLGKERIAYLEKSVKLTDGSVTLLTENLEYDLATGIASYKNGGKVVNGKTTLTSGDAVYYSNTKDVYFKKNVHLTDPQYNIKADSLLYNTQYKTATFISPTSIVTKEGGRIYTKSGTYNLERREAIFYDRTSYRDSTRSLTGGKIAFDEKNGILQAEENAKLVDSVNNVTVLGNQILLDKNKKTFLATRKPVMILYRGKDSTYITADTLFSGQKKWELDKDSVRNRNDSSYNKKALDVSSANKDSIRYFMAFHHVRIFNDSLQAVCDSLQYSAQDSVFRMFKDPLCWNNQTQLSGDTIYLYTKKQQPDRLYVFNNGMVINQSGDKLFNQMAGRTINGYFKDGNIDYIRIKGSPAESIFYPQDQDSAYIGMNRSSGDVIDIFFVKEELNKVKFVNDVNGTLYPLKKIPKGEEFLKGFKWLDSRRPKNKFELFE